VQVPLRFNYLFALEPIYLNIKGIDLLLIIIIERLEYTLPLFWTRPVKPRLITYQLLYDVTALASIVNDHHIASPLQRGM